MPAMISLHFMVSHSTIVMIFYSYASVNYNRSHTNPHPLETKLQQRTQAEKQQKKWVKEKLWTNKKSSQTSKTTVKTSDKPDVEQL